ncbi:aldehyde dehydrogenase family protein [Patulibacter minatonensis]|uniref:aldehyde dehydrogenase family protein n=1 Tax=Patulibacter minatonensis TaxID=298163 RepID=UPI000478B19F|nr:aldehyde dehydrogenase family protein [Patulibacter minatonensis]
MATTAKTTTGPGGDAEDRIVVRCPADGHLVGEVPVQTTDEVRAIADRLRAAQPAWEALGFAGRARWLGLWRDWFLDNGERLAGIVQEETGKSWNDAGVEAPTAVEVINYYAEHGEAFLRTEHPKPHTKAMAIKQLSLEYSPHRLVGVISPWNAPVGVPAFDVPGALMAGSAVLTKSSEWTPLAWEEVVRGWNEDLGAPAVLGSVTGAGETGAAVVDVVDFLQFTGSAHTGRRIAARCGERLIPCSLELGGKDAMIVLADADLERAASGAVWGGFFNAGQICVSVERLYVEDAVHDAFVALVTEKVAALRVGMETGQDIAYDYGAMANEAQIDIVDRHVADARDKGARVLAGGARRPGQGLFYEPTVLVDVDHGMDCMREETFGPTLPIMRVADEAEAIARANDSEYGLSASVWTTDRARGERVASALNAGGVNINDMYINMFQMPLPQGGWGASGIGGRLGGAAGIRKFCRERAVVRARVAPKTEIQWYPASNRSAGIQGRATRFLGARDWRRKLGLKPRP